MRTRLRFRVWAPDRNCVSVVLEDDRQKHDLEASANGYFEGVVTGVSAGARYRLQFDDDDELFTDPASRFQPEGPQGPSLIVDPLAFI